MKVGKEEIVGLLAALERFVASDETADRARLCQTAAHIAAALADLSMARVALVERTELWPIIRVEIPNASRRSAIEVARALEAGAPPVYLATGDARAGRLAIDPFCLQPGEAEIVVARLRSLLVG